MKFVSLFSGAGGMDLGLERAGHECVCQVEIEHHPLSVLRKHWPHVPKIKDVRDANRNNLPDFDLLAFGFPCTNVSIAGCGEGLAGDASGLWFEAHRITMECRPKVVLVENVPGLFSSSNRQDFGIVLGGLLGFPVGIPIDGWRGAGIAKGRIYHVAWRVLDSQFFGVAQQRRRVFFAASLVGSGINPAEILFEREGLPRNYSARGQAQKTAATTPQGCANSSGQPPGLIARPLCSSDGRRGGITDTMPYVADKLSPTLQANFGTKLGLENQHIDNGGVFRRLQPAVAKTLTSSNQRLDMETENFISESFRTNGNGDVFELGNKSSALTTQTDPTSSFILEANAIRRLTPNENELLQDWPIDHTRFGILENGKEVEIKDGPRYTMIGNGVTANVAEWIGIGIADAMAALYSSLPPLSGDFTLV